MIRVVKKPQERREEIISVAQELFLENEYEKTTLQDVMNKLGIAKGTIYHYFNSKEELLEAVVENMADAYVKRLCLVFEEVKGNALDRMRSLVSAGRVANGEGGLMERLHMGGNMGLHLRLLALIVMKIAPLYADVIRQGCSEGIFKSEHPLETAETLLAGIQFITDVGIYHWSKEDIARREAAIPALLEMQLGAPKGSFNFF